MSDLLYMLALLCLLAAPFFALKAIRKQMPWKNAALALGGFFVLGLLGASVSPSGALAEECVPVSEEFAAMLIEDLPGATLNHTYAVKLRDQATFYYVSGQFTNPNAFGNEVNSAVWATDDLNGQGLVFAVDGFARTGSNWGDGTTTSLALSSADPDAVMAQQCSDAAAKG